MQDSSVAEETLGPIVNGADLADLATIYDPDAMLVTAPTPAGEAALAHARALAAAGPRSESLKVHLGSEGAGLGELEALSLRDAPHARAWVEYLGDVVSLFGELLGATTVGVRMLVADGPSCPRFHVDKVHARGVLNVVGPCTEWLQDEDLDRTRLGHLGGSDDRTSGLVKRWDGIARAAHCELAVFKGTAWPGATDRAIVHRSPPKDGSRRVVLTLDWVE